MRAAVLRGGRMVLRDDVAALRHRGVEHIGASDFSAKRRELAAPRQPPAWWWRACAWDPTPCCGSSRPRRRSASSSCSHKTWANSRNRSAIAEGGTDVAPLVTGEMGLDGVGAAYDDLAHPDAHGNILVTP